MSAETPYIAQDGNTHQHLPDVSAKPKKAKAAKSKAAAKPKPAKKEKAKRQPKSGLRLFQVRTLLVLDKSNDPLTSAGIAKRAKISNTMVVMGLGTIDPALRKTHDAKMEFPSLLTLGHAKVVEIDGHTGVQITSSGRAALKKALEAAGGKLKPVKKVKDAA